MARNKNGGPEAAVPLFTAEAGFFVNGALAAPIAVLFIAELPLHLLFVLGGVVITARAGAALQGD